MPKLSSTLTYKPGCLVQIILDISDAPGATFDSATFVPYEGRGLFAWQRPPGCDEPEATDDLLPIILIAAQAEPFAGRLKIVLRQNGQLLPPVIVRFAANALDPCDCCPPKK